MKNKKKLVLIILMVLVLICVSYITFDCVRLYNSPLGTKPIITIDTEQTENRLIHKGLGYSVRYYIDREEKTEAEMATDVEQYSYGAEFRFLNKILVWAWIE